MIESGPYSNSPIRLVPTADGSSTIERAQDGEAYHSLNGALSEARYVFAGQGIDFWLARRGGVLRAPSIRILEYGLGTGMNFLATAERALSQNIGIDYLGIEGMPLPDDLLRQVQTADAPARAVEAWRQGMRAPWGGRSICTEAISLTKVHASFEDFLPCRGQYDIAFFDAFSPASVPAQWTPRIFERLYFALGCGGVFVTYSASGIAKRALRAAGFGVKRLPGALGKHHMLVAFKSPQSPLP